MSGREPAYPVPAYETFHGEVVYPESGLTKREAFAMAAMQGLSANPEFFKTATLKSYGEGLGLSGNVSAAKLLALASLQHADATLAALDQEG